MKTEKGKGLQRVHTMKVGFLYIEECVQATMENVNRVAAINFSRHSLLESSRTRGG